MKYKRTKPTKGTPTVSTSTAASSLNAETSCTEILSSDLELEVQSNLGSDSEVINLPDEWDDWIELGSGESDDIIMILRCNELTDIY